MNQFMHVVFDQEQDEDVEIYARAPVNFNHQIQVAACYLEIEGKLLLLQLADHKPEARRWGVPGGKLEEGESKEAAAQRELYEETGLSVDFRHIQYLDARYIRKFGIDFVYHMFKVSVVQMPEVQISSEHCCYLWASSQELNTLPLMLGAKQLLIDYRMLQQSRRQGATVNAYLVLKQGDNILMLLRKQTGYYDGMWGLVSGHIEDGESATAGMVREVKEEIGITIIPADLKVVHVMHRKTDRLNIDVFFECFSWEGVIENREPDKCEQVAFFPKSSLPPFTIDYIKEALHRISTQGLYSEFGWNGY